MKRRDFVKTTSISLACTALVCAGMPAHCKPRIKDFYFNRKFSYKNKSELPKIVKLDICSLCQLNCAACWIRSDEELIKKNTGGFGYVNFETFKSFVDDNPFIEQIELSKNGEIFLNPELDKIIQYAFEKNIALTALNGVNLNTLPESTAEALVKYKFRDIVVSIDGATPETYAIYRRGGNFNTVINNVRKINKYKKQYNSEYPHLIYKMILFGHNEHEIDAAKKLAESLNMDIRYDINAIQDYSPLKDKEALFKKLNLYYSDDLMTSFFERYKNDKSQWMPCKDLWDSPQINFNGDLYVCGCNTPTIHIYGPNVFRDGFLNAMNSEKVIYTKRMLTDLSTPPRDDIPCSECRIYNLLRTNNIPIS